MDTTQTVPPAIGASIKRFFHVLWEPRSYLIALYLLTSFPLGLTYFVVLVTGGIVGAVLAVLMVGLLVLLACIVAAWGFALFERELKIWLLGVRIAPLSLPSSEILSPWQMLVRHLQQPTTWRSLAFLLVKLPFGMFVSFLTAAILGPCLAGIFIPVGDFASDGPRLATLEAFIFPGVPAVLGLTVGLHILNWLGRAWGRFAADMLGVSTDQHQVWEARRRAEQADRSRRELIMNSSLIAVLGLVIGALIGLWESYRFFVIDKSFGTVIFHVPALDITLILVAAYCATLVTTFLPARSASRVAPAEALRYE